MMLYLSIQTYRSPNPSETATFEGYKNINTGEINLFSGQHNHGGIPKLSYRDGPTGPGRR